MSGTAAAGTLPTPPPTVTMHLVNSYDPAGRVNSLVQLGSSPATYTLSHNGAGDLTTLLAPNGGQQTWSYDTAGRVTGTSWISGTTSLFTQTVTLDAAGQRSMSNDSWGTSSYGYDPAGRLTSASYPDGSTEADQYDASGNRTGITSTSPVAGTSVVTNTYDRADELTGTTGTPGTTTYSYDGPGRQIGSTGSGGLVTNTYNDLGQLTQVQGPTTNVSYVYDGQGDRLRSYEQYGPTPVLTNDVQDLAAGLSDLVSDGTADYTYLTPGSGQAPVSAYTQSTTRSSYLGSDLLGSVRLATDPTGAVIGAGAYDAWGVYRPYQGASGPIQLAGLQASSPFGYAGQYYDSGPGTYGMRAREYNPVQGRFISQDPQPYAPQVPVTMNPYEYAGDMVTQTTDPSGQGWVQVTVPAATDALLREAALSQFVADDPTHLSFTHVQLAASTGDPTVAVGQADLVSISPILHQGKPYGEAYDLVPYQDTLTTGAVNLFSAAQIPSEQALLENAYLHGLHLGAGAQCRSYNHLRLVAGQVYPDSAGLRDTHTNDYFAGPVVQKIVQVGSDVYLSNSWQRGPGVVAYTTCRWQNGPGLACPAPPSFHRSCLASFDPLTCTVDLLLLGGSLGKLAACPATDVGCQGLALLGTVVGAATSAFGLNGTVSIFTERALAAEGADALVNQITSDTTVLETHDGTTVLLNEAEAKELVSEISKGRAIKATSMAREDAAVAIVQEQFPQAQILEERYLLNAQGKKITDLVEGRGRRLDIVVVEDNKVVAIREVTTPTEALGKGPQLAKTLRIRSRGEVFVRDPITRKLIPVPPGVTEELLPLP
ncbi:MAG TPA: RHS repeat-associated core domain-containing protein [Chloroflexota bacterium]|nr:RHS repeat-associated core domain-containing protein [Chloroflexota bacterium]